MITMMWTLLALAPAPRLPAVIPRCSAMTYDYTMAQKIERADAIFVGVALDVWPETGRTRDTVTFVVEASWKGEHPDTMSVVMAGGCPAYIVPGVTYVIVANGSRESYIANTGVNGMQPRLHSDYPGERAYADSLLAPLGKPAWEAPPPGERSIDRAPPSMRDSTVFSGFSIDRTFGPDVRIAASVIGADVSVRYDHNPYSNAVYIVGLVPGNIYRLHVQLPDGRSEDHYFRIRCLKPSTPSHCFYSRTLDIGRKYEPLPSVDPGLFISAGMTKAIAELADTSLTARKAERVLVDASELARVLKTVSGDTLRASDVRAMVAASKGRIVMAGSLEAGCDNPVFDCRLPENTVTIRTTGASISGDDLTVAMDLSWNSPSRHGSVPWNAKMHREKNVWHLSSIFIPY